MQKYFLTAVSSMMCVFGAAIGPMYMGWLWVTISVINLLAVLLFVWTDRDERKS